MHTGRYAIPQAFEAVFGRQCTRGSFPGAPPEEASRFFLLVRFVGEHAWPAVLLVVEDLLPRACCLELRFSGWRLRLAVFERYRCEVRGVSQLVFVGLGVLSRAVGGVGVCDGGLGVVGIESFLCGEARALIAGRYVSARPDRTE